MRSEENHRQLRGRRGLRKRGGEVEQKKKKRLSEQCIYNNCQTVVEANEKIK